MEMDAICLIIATAFFLIAWVLVGALDRLHGGGQS